MSSSLSSFSFVVERIDSLKFSIFEFTTLRLFVNSCSLDPASNLGFEGTSYLSSSNST